jgi:AmiR/NasT family two-component response regulator
MPIVMARTGCTDEQAQHWLADASQRSNRKMRVLAERIVHTGSLQV